jgi:hypothetical protein
MDLTVHEDFRLLSLTFTRLDARGKDKNKKVNTARTYQYHIQLNKNNDQSANTIR